MYRINCVDKYLFITLMYGINCVDRKKEREKLNHCAKSSAKSAHHDRQVI